MLSVVRQRRFKGYERSEAKVSDHEATGRREGSTTAKHRGRRCRGVEWLVVAGRKAVG